MKILATDLDRTLLPNGHWPADPGAVALFNQLTRDHGVRVVYVTGRSLALAEAAVREFGIRHPDALIGDVGTSIYRRTADRWEPHPGWAGHVRRASPRWDAAAVRAALAPVAGLEEQPREHCGPFKQSYFLDHGRHEAILEAADRQVKGRFDEVAIYSYDSQADTGLLDLLPASATKQTALEYLAADWDTPKAEVVFCGDSGNDVFPLTAGFAGVMVRNADEQLVARVQQAAAANPALRVYHARGGYRGLNGYYTSGVLEGAEHYGLFA
jgi:sucrose-6F-phosphate phosphohydrolase